MVHQPDALDVRLRLLAQPAAVAAAGLGAVAFVSWLGHVGLSVVPDCPFLTVTGLWCPLCGGTRAVQALTSGDVGAALGYNVLVVIAIPMVVAAWARWTLGRARGRPTQLLTLSSRALAVATGVALLYMVVRNVPGLEMLTPSR